MIRLFLNGFYFGCRHPEGGIVSKFRYFPIHSFYLTIINVFSLTFFLLLSAPSTAEILIGLGGPLTGKLEWTGEEMDMGVQHAVDDLNASGGVLGQSVRLIKVDDACNPEQAVAAAQKLASDKVVMVVGHYCSSTSIAARAVYTAHDILMISPGSTATQFTDEGGKNIFRLIGRDDQQGKVAADYLARDWGTQKIAILHDNDAYGTGLAQNTKKHLNALKVQEVYYGGYTAAKGDYQQVVDQLKAHAVDVVYVGGYDEDVSNLLLLALDQGLKFSLVSGDGISGKAFWLTAGASGQGTRFTFVPDYRKKPSALSAVENFRKENFEPGGYTLYAYAAVQVWAQAVEQINSLKMDKVSDHMHKATYDTGLGKIGFDDNGDLTGIPGWSWYEWTAGKFKPVGEQ